MSASRNVQIAKKISLWFSKNQRTLPWRIDQNPYAIWISEIMLQQTQVATVIPYFNRFMERFPTVFELAKADLEEVYRFWAGLGYYSRARNLHRGAQFLAEQFEKSGFPKDRDGWLAVPGVGEYTAGAICSIAYRQREPIVDGNVVRVLSRVFAIAKIDSKKTEIWERARKLVEAPMKPVRPDLLNAGLMELGALVCRPNQPRCNDCPVKSECLGKNHPDRYPPKKAKPKLIRVQEHRWVVLSGDRVLLKKTVDSKWRNGLWDFPEAKDLETFPKQRLALGHKFEVKYAVTIHRIHRQHQVARAGDPGTIPLYLNQNSSESEFAWVLVTNLNHLEKPVPAPVKKALLIAIKTS